MSWLLERSRTLRLEAKAFHADGMEPASLLSAMDTVTRLVRLPYEAGKLAPGPAQCQEHVTSANRKLRA